MTLTQARFPIAPALTEALAEGERRAAEAFELAEAQWCRAVESWILLLPKGSEFIAEDAVLAVGAHGFTTPNRKAVGAIVKALSRHGVISPTGSARRARTSHGSLKPVWRRS